MRPGRISAEQKRAKGILRQHSEKLFKEHAGCCGVGMLYDPEDKQMKMTLLVKKRKPEHEKFLNQKFGSKIRDKNEGKAQAGEVSSRIIEVGDKGIVPLSERTAKRRPCPGGVSVGHTWVSAGTFGGTCYLTDSEGRRERKFLTNKHVAAPFGLSSLGDAIVQPGMYDLFGWPVELGNDNYPYWPDEQIEQAIINNLIGNLHSFVQLHICSYEDYFLGLCYDNINWNYSDAALVTPLSGPKWKSGEEVSAGRWAAIRQGDTGLMYRCKLAHTTAADNKPESGPNWTTCWDCVDVYDSIVNVGLTGEADTPLCIYELVCKSGRTSERNEGLFFGWADIEVGYDTGVGFFRDQLAFSPILEGGDSGSLLLRKADKKPVGLCFAGSSDLSFANPIEKVVEELESLETNKSIHFIPATRLALTGGCVWELGKHYYVGNKITGYGWAATGQPLGCILEHIATYDNMPGSDYAYLYWGSATWKVHAKNVAEVTDPPSEPIVKVCKDCCEKVQCYPPGLACNCPSKAEEWVEGTWYDPEDKVNGNPDTWKVYNCTVGHFATVDNRPSSGVEWPGKWEVYLNLAFIQLEITGDHLCYECCNDCTGGGISRSARGDINGKYTLKWAGMNPDTPTACYWEAWGDCSAYTRDHYCSDCDPECPMWIYGEVGCPINIRYEVTQRFEGGPPINFGVLTINYSGNSEPIWWWVDPLDNCVEGEVVDPWTCEGVCPEPLCDEWIIWPWGGPMTLKITIIPQADVEKLLSAGMPGPANLIGEKTMIRKEDTITANTTPLPARRGISDIAKSVAGKIGGCCSEAALLIKGYIRYGTDISGLTSTSEQAIQRLGICQSCEFQTYWSKEEYKKWLSDNKADIFKNFDRLAELPTLEIRPKSEARQERFCSICKCWLEAKVRAGEKAICPKNRWPVNGP